MRLKSINILFVMVVLLSCGKSEDQFLTEKWAVDIRKNNGDSILFTRLTNQAYILYKANKNEDAVKKYFESLRYNADSNLYYALGNALSNLSRLHDALKAYKISLILGSKQKFLIYYNIACLYSRMKERENAFYYLSKAVNSGYSAFSYILNDNDLVFLRSQKDWPLIFESIKLGLIITLDSNPKKWSTYDVHGGITVFGPIKSITFQEQGNYSSPMKDGIMDYIEKVHDFRFFSKNRLLHTSDKSTHTNYQISIGQIFVGGFYIKPSGAKYSYDKEDRLIKISNNPYYTFITYSGNRIQSCKLFVDNFFNPQNPVIHLANTITYEYYSNNHISKKIDVGRYGKTVSIYDLKGRLTTLKSFSGDTYNYTYIGEDRYGNWKQRICHITGDTSLAKKITLAMNVEYGK